MKVVATKNNINVYDIFSGNHSTRKLREAVHTIDKFSIRLGVFLRRYPAARMMVIGYMVSIIVPGVRSCIW